MILNRPEFTQYFDKQKKRGGCGEAFKSHVATGAKLGLGAGVVFTPIIAYKYKLKTFNHLARVSTFTTLSGLMACGAIGVLSGIFDCLFGPLIEIDNERKVMKQRTSS